MEPQGPSSPVNLGGDKAANGPPQQDMAEVYASLMGGLAQASAKFYRLGPEIVVKGLARLVGSMCVFNAVPGKEQVLLELAVQEMRRSSTRHTLMRQSAIARQAEEMQIANQVTRTGQR